MLVKFDGRGILVWRLMIHDSQSHCCLSCLWASSWLPTTSLDTRWTIILVGSWVSADLAAFLTAQCSSSLTQIRENHLNDGMSLKSPPSGMLCPKLLPVLKICLLEHLRCCKGAVASLNWYLPSIVQYLSQVSLPNAAWPSNKLHSKLFQTLPSSLNVFGAGLRIFLFPTHTAASYC